MKTFAYIIFLCFIFSCGSIKKSVTVVGEYKSQRTNRVRVIVDYHLSGKIYVKDSMSVNQDATFIFKTCGNIIKGNWKVSNDSLLLFVKSNRYRIDSLNYFFDFIYLTFIYKILKTNIKSLTYFIH